MSSPDYTHRQNECNDYDVNLEYKSEHAEVVSLLKTGKNDIALLPEPFVTIAMTTVENANIALKQM